MTTLPSNRRWTAAGLLLLILCGLALRLPYMTRSFWFDEIFTANLATFNTTFGSILDFLKPLDPHPPLHYLLMKTYALATGLHAWPSPTSGIEWMFRLPSLLLGLASIPLAYRFGLHFSPWSAWTAAIAVACSPFTIGESVEARMYSALTFCTLLSWVLLFRGSPRALLLAGLVNALGIWQQVIYIIPLAAQFLYILTRRDLGRDWRTYLRLYLLPATVLVWAPYIYAIYQIGGVNAGIRTSARTVGLGLFDYFTGRNSLLNLLFFALIAVALFRATWTSRLLSVFVPTLGIAFLWLLGSLVVNISSYRYAGFIVPGFAAIIGLGIHEVQQWLRPRWPTRPATLLPLALTGLYILAQFPPESTTVRVMREPWREVAQVIARDMRDDDLLVISELGRQISILYYLRTPAKYTSLIGNGLPDTLRTLDSRRAWVIPESFGAPVENADAYQKWVKDTLLSDRSKKMLHTEKFDLYLVQPATTSPGMP